MHKEVGRKEKPLTLEASSEAFLSGVKFNITNLEVNFNICVDVNIDTDVVIADYPQLQLLCWNIQQPCIPEIIAFGLYERNWKHVSEQALTQSEVELINRLKENHGRGLFLD